MIPQGEDKEGRHEYGKSQGKGDPKGVGDHVNPIASHGFKGSCSSLKSTMMMIADQYLSVFIIVISMMNQLKVDLWQWVGGQRY